MKLVTNEFEKLRNVCVNDAFWGTYTDLVKNVIIPYQWEALNDRVPDTEPSHAIKNFRIAAGLEEGEFHGYVFQDSDVAKWLEAVAYRLTIAPDAELEATADSVIDLLEQAQCEDGYLMTYFQIKEPGKRFTNLLDCHELYCAGHMAEAAVAYYESTGKRKLLDIMCRFLDLIDATIGPEEGKLHGYSGHPEIELALIRVYEATGEERYLNLCNYMVNQRGTTPHFFDEEVKRRDYIDHWGGKVQKVDKKYNQSHLPIREQKTAVGHSVRAGYLYTGVAGLAAETGDETLRDACRTLWDNVTQKQMYITGGIGSQPSGEAFSFDYHLPNDTAYTETCAAISLAFFAKQMMRMEANGAYGDVLERVLYNGSISGMALDGRHFFYTNPLSMWEEATKHVGGLWHIRPKRPGWFGCACCPPNLARLIASLGSYLYSKDSATIYAHLFIGSEATIELPQGKISVRQQSSMPWDGNVTFTLGGGDYTFAFRVPAWAKTFSVTVNGEAVQPKVENGYAYLSRTWTEGDVVALSLPMEVTLVAANPLVRADCGRVAIMRGPIVYCLESADNGDDLDAIRLLDAPFSVEEDSTLFPGARIITGAAQRRRPWTEGTLYAPIQNDAYEPCTVRAIPYAFWDNREDTREMQVWMRLHER